MSGRRLRLSLLVVVGLVAACCGEKPDDEPHRYKVIVVGGGLAGITAASTLIRNKVDDLLVLEGSLDIGGRIYYRNEGALLRTWSLVFSGTEDLIREHLESLGVADILAPPPGDSDDSDSKFAIPRTFRGRELNYQDFDYITDQLDVNCSQIDKVTDHSYKNFVEPRVNKAMNDRNVPEHDREVYWDMLNKWIERESGPMAKVGLHYTALDRNHYPALRTEPNKYLMDALMGTYPQNATDIGLESKIVLKKTVKKITYGDSGVEVLAADTENSTDTMIYHADKVIVTVSLGVLKEKDIEFVPPLPSRKLDAIESFGVQNFNFFYLFWNASNPNVDNDKIRKTFDSPVWFGLTKEEKQRLLVPLGFLRAQWFLSLDNWAANFDSDDEYHLRASIAGPDSTKAVTWFDNASISKINKALNAYFTNLLPNVPIPEMESAMMSSWDIDTHQHGSYPYQTVESEKKGLTPKDLAEPLLNMKQTPVVYFAGDATSTKNFGTVTGAFETGMDVAKKILGSMS